MAKLNMDGFSEDFKQAAPMECALYLYECLEDDKKEQIKNDWNNIGGVNVIPWWKWCMEHIEVSYNR